MNWTGGRLRRSKANGNPLLKTQKQHFAKARLRLQNGQSSQPPFTFSVTHAQDAYGQDEPLAEDFSRHHNKSLTTTLSHEIGPGAAQPTSTHCEATARPRPKRRRSGSQLEHMKTIDLVAVSRQSRPAQMVNKDIGRHVPSILEINRKSVVPEDNTIENVKRKLLKKSDWMGLSATRPVRMSFADVEDVEHIGKRRKIAVEGNRKRRAVRTALHHRQHINTRPRLHLGHRDTSILPAQNASIRIGSRIHQSQTTPMVVPNEQSHYEMAASVSTESMLLDELDHDLPLIKTQQQAEDATIPADNLSSVSQGDHCEEHYTLPLMSLDQVRDSVSFDEVKVRNSSRSSIGLGFPAFSSPRTVYRKAANRGLKIRTDHSSSMVNRHRVLPLPTGQMKLSSRTPPAAQRTLIYDTHPKRKQTPVAGPTTLSSGFWPQPDDRSRSKEAIEKLTGDIHSGSKAAPAFAEAGDLSVHSPPPSRSSSLDLRVRRNRDLLAMRRPKFTLDEQAQRGGNFGLLRSSSRSLSPATRPDHHLMDGPRGPEQNKNVQPRTTSPDHMPSAVQICKNRKILASAKARNCVKVADATRQYSSQPAIEVPALCQNVSALGWNPPLPIQHTTLQQPTHEGAFRYHPLRGQQSVHAPLHQNVDSSLSARQSVENETWMKYVFKDFDDIRNGFKFAPTCERQKPVDNILLHGLNLRTEKTSVPEEALWRPPSSQGGQISSPPNTIQTSANTILFRPLNLHSPDQLSMTQPSETDFLSLMSPMEGRLDDRLADISVYNNPARSMRSFIPIPGVDVQSARLMQPATATTPCNDTRPVPKPTRLLNRWPTNALADNTTSQGGPFVAGDPLSGSQSTPRQPLQALLQSTPLVSSRSVRLPQARFAQEMYARDLSPRAAASWVSPPEKVGFLGGVSLQTSGPVISSFPLDYTPVKSTSRSQVVRKVGMIPVELGHSSQASSTSHRNEDARVPRRHDSHDATSLARASLNIGKVKPTQSHVIYSSPSAQENVIQSTSTASPGFYVKAIASDESTANPTELFSNIHAKSCRPFVFQRARPTDVVQSSSSPQHGESESPHFLNTAPKDRVPRRGPRKFDRFTQPYRERFGRDSGSDDIESVLSK